MEMAADEIWKPFHLPGRFLHEKQVRLFSFYERSDVFYRRAYPAKQIPANNFQRDDLSGRPARAPHRATHALFAGVRPSAPLSLPKAPQAQASAAPGIGHYG
jgi:hypothetical protein